MILTDLATHNKRRLKQHDVMSIARSVKSGLARLASMGYVRGAVAVGERGIVVVTTQGRRFEVAVREISCDEEIMQAQAYSAALVDPKNLPPVTSPPRDPAIQALATEAAKLRGTPIHLPQPEPRSAVITGKAARVLEARSTLAGLQIDGEYVYRNYAVNYDGRTWDDLTPSERQSWDDQAALLVGRLSRKKPTPPPVAAVKTPEPVTGRDLYMTMIDNSGVHCNRFPAWSELDEAAQADWNRKATS